MSTSPTSLSAEQLAEIVTKSGRVAVTEADIQADIDDGAPVNNDGTLNLLHYAAWLAAKR